VFVYKSEILETSFKWGSHRATQEDVARFDNFINEKAADDWELVTHCFMENVWGCRAAILATFRKQK
jgi:hypothetical protein